MGEVKEDRVPFWQPHLDVMLSQRSVFMETSKRDWVNSVYITEEEHWLPLPVDAHHVDESP